MKKIDISRALRDSEYRNSLTAAEQAMLPAHPAGPSAVADDVLRSLTGGCAITGCSNCGGGTPTSFDPILQEPNSQCLVPC